MQKFSGAAVLTTPQWMRMFAIFHGSSEARMAIFAFSLYMFLIWVNI